MTGEDLLWLSHLVVLMTVLLLPAATIGAGYIWWLWWKHPEPRPKFWFMTSVVVAVVWACSVYLVVVGAARYLDLPTEWLPLGRAIVALLLVLSTIWTARYVHDTRRQK